MNMRWVLAVLAFGFLALGRGNADQVTYTYDDAGRLTLVAYATGVSIAYAYDAAGNLLTRSLTAPASGNSASQTTQSTTPKPDASQKTKPTRPPRKGVVFRRKGAGPSPT